MHTKYACMQRTTHDGGGGHPGGFGLGLGNGEASVQSRESSVGKVFPDSLVYSG